MSKNIDERVWGHRELIEDLADSFIGSRIIFAEATIGSRWLSGGAVGVPDVFTLEKSYTTPIPTVYEVKVSKKDFIGDVRKEKWTRYVPYCRRFYFAAPRGMLAKKDLPEGTGLITRGPEGWSVAVAPRTTKGDGLSLMDAQALLMAGCYTMERVRRLRERVVLAENVEIGDRCKKLGWQISEAISRLKGGETAAAGGHVMEAVAKVLGVDVLALVAMREIEIEERLIDRKKVGTAVALISELATQLEWSIPDVDKAVAKAKAKVRL